jgi:hypothetical protein
MFAVELDARDLVAAAELFPSAVAQEFGESLDAIGDAGVTSGKATVRFKNRTGRLRRSIRKTAKRVATDYAEIDVAAGSKIVFYSRYVEDGTIFMSPRKYMHNDVYLKTRGFAELELSRAMARALESVGLG